MNIALLTRMPRARRTDASTTIDAKPGRKPKDPRVEALKRFAISITAFNIIGRLWLGFETSWAALVVALATAYSMELLLEYVDAKTHHRQPRFTGGVKSFVIFLLPAHIGATAISMLIYPSEDLWPFAFAVAVATAGKYLVQAPVGGKMRHILNPSNLGISATLFLFPWVGVGLPYQFTEGVDGVLAWIIPIAVFASGLMLNWKLTRKMPLILSWVGFFALQAVLRGLSPEVSMRGALSPMTGLAFLLFTTYMITDPGTTPFRPRNQVIFGAACAAIYAGFMLIHQVYGIFYAVVIVCAVRGAYHWFIYLQKRGESETSSALPVVVEPAASAGLDEPAVPAEPAAGPAAVIDSPAVPAAARPEPLRTESD